MVVSSPATPPPLDLDQVASMLASLRPGWTGQGLTAGPLWQSADGPRARPGPMSWVAIGRGSGISPGRLLVPGAALTPQRVGPCVFGRRIQITTLRLDWRSLVSESWL